MKPSIAILAPIVVSLSLAACSAPLAAADPSTTPYPTLGASPGTSPGTSAIPSIAAAPVVVSPSPAPTPSAPSGKTLVIRAYFLLGGPEHSAGLVPVLREIPATKAVGATALGALLDGPTADERGASPAISSAIPAGTELLGLSIEDGVATVDLSAEFEAGGGSASQIGRLGQVVYTLTQFPTVESVAFRLGGRPVTVFGTEGIVLNGPVGRVDGGDSNMSMFESILPAILVDGPAWGAALGNPGRVRGTANTYEAWFSLTLHDATGRALNQWPGQATCGTGCRGTFEETLTYAVSEPQWGILRVLDGDESGRDRWRHPRLPRVAHPRSAR